MLDDGILSGLTKLRTLSLDHLGLRCLPAIPSKVKDEALQLDDDMTSERTRASYPSCSTAGRLPEAPTHVTVASASSTSATLSWTLPSGTWSSVDVRWRSLTTDDEPASEWSSKNITRASVTQATVTAMTASTTYQFEVRVNDATRKGVWSRRVSLPSGRGPGVGPSDAAAVVVSPTAVTVDEDGGTATYTVKLATQPSADVTVTPTSSDSTAATATGALTFTNTNWNVAQSVTVTGVNNHSGGSRTATISHTVAGGDYASVSAPSVAVTVSDDDNAAVVIASTAVTVDEDGGTATYTVKLATQPSADVTVTPTSDTTTAATVSGALTFTTTNWNNAQTVTVTGVDDRPRRRRRRHEVARLLFSVVNSTAGGGYANVSAPLVTVFVTDNNKGVLVSIDAAVVEEDAGTFTYTVNLAAQPSASVTVTPTSSDSTIATVSGALTFTTASWNTAQEVTITGVDDDIDNTGDSRSATISHTVAGGGYASVTAPSVAVTVSDDDSTPSPAVCDRTAKVRDAFVAAVSGKTACAQISAHDLAALTTLNLSNQSLTALTADDFNGLAGLETLRLHEKQIASLPSGIFDEAASLTTLELDDNRLASLPSGVFDNNTKLTTLQLYHNLLTSLPAGAFDNNTKLTSLSLGDNRLASLPVGVFDNNAKLTKLYLHGNELTTVAAGTFTNNTALTELALGYNRFSTLPASLFSANAELVGLYLGGSWYYPALGWVTLPGYYNGESLVLPDAVFSGLTKLKYLSLDDVGLQCLPVIPASVRQLKLDEDLSSDRTRASYPSCSSDSLLPAPVTGLATPTANATSATLSWTLPAGTWNGVDVRWRSVGSNDAVSAWSPASVAGSATQTTITLPSSGQSASSDVADTNGLPGTHSNAVAQTGSTAYQFEVRVNSADHKGVWSRRVSVPAGVGPGVAPVDDTAQQPPRRGSNNDGNNGGSPTGSTGGGRSGAARPERLSGADRWATAAAVSNKLVELLEAVDPTTGTRQQVATVIVASGQAFPDALTAAALSRVLRAPVLLTSQRRLEQPVRAFIARHRPATAVIVGGPRCCVRRRRGSAAGHERDRHRGAPRRHRQIRDGCQGGRGSGRSGSAVRHGQADRDRHHRAQLSRRTCRRPAGLPRTAPDPAHRARPAARPDPRLARRLGRQARCGHRRHQGSQRRRARRAAPPGPHGRASQRHRPRRHLRHRRPQADLAGRRQRLLPQGCHRPRHRLGVPRRPRSSSPARPLRRPAAAHQPQRRAAVPCRVLRRRPARTRLRPAPCHHHRRPLRSAHRALQQTPGRPPPLTPASAPAELREQRGAGAGRRSRAAPGRRQGCCPRSAS